MLSLAAAKNFAILVNGSINFPNYRHTSNVVLLSKILIENGYTKDEIVVLCGENSLQDVRNTDPGHIHISENLKLPIPNLDFEVATARSVYDALYCNHRKLLDVDSNSNVTIYLTGHGNKKFLKIQYREAIFASDFIRAVGALAGRVRKILVIVDTCNSGSFLDVVVPENVIMVASSLVNESSFSSLFSLELGTHSIDNFIYNFWIITQTYKNESLRLLFGEFNNEKMKSTVNFKAGKSEEFGFSDFFLQNDSQCDAALVPFKVSKWGW